MTSSESIGRHADQSQVVSENSEEIGTKYPGIFLRKYRGQLSIQYVSLQPAESGDEERVFREDIIPINKLSM